MYSEPPQNTYNDIYHYHALPSFSRIAGLGRKYCLIQVAGIYELHSTRQGQLFTRNGHVMRAPGVGEMPSKTITIP
jgi:hypothetical protein